MSTDSQIIKSLSDIGINICIQDDRLRLTGNLQGLTDDMKDALHREKAAIIVALSSPYPNEDGQVKCVYCLSYRNHQCTHGHQPDGISLLRECNEFCFNRTTYDDFYANVKG
jgi:hypothetical protein